jgi:ABC-type uncharacterized transport system permease subunit
MCASAAAGFITAYLTGNWFLGFIAGSHTDGLIQLFFMLPFVVVIIVMSIFKKQIEFPASVGKPYSRE